MHVRAVVTMFFVIVASMDAIGQNVINAANVGDAIIIRMTGALAKEYAKRHGHPAPNDRQQFSIEVPARISQSFDGQYLVDHSSPVNSSNRRRRMITLSAIIDLNRVDGKSPPRGLIDRSPDDRKNVVVPTIGHKGQTTKVVELSVLKGIKLQTWELTEEIGN